MKMIKGRRHYKASCNSCSADRGWKIKQELDRMCGTCASKLANKKSQIARAKNCTVSDCSDKHFGKGFCNKHYEQNRRPSTKGKEFKCANGRCQSIFLRSGNQKYCSSTCNTAAYYWRNRDKIREKRRQSETLKKYRKEYSAKNRERLNKNKNERYKNDIEFRIKETLRTRLSKALVRNTKTGSAVKDLGCSIKDLKTHLESKFTEGMSWDNYGEWHIDHVKPLANFNLTSELDIKEVCHYTNLQPLWAKDNISKGAK